MKPRLIDRLASGEFEFDLSKVQIIQSSLKCADNYWDDGAQARLMAVAGLTQARKSRA